MKLTKCFIVGECLYNKRRKEKTMGKSSEDVLDKMVNEAAERILFRYADKGFYDELGERFTGILKTMVSDGVKFGMALAEVIHEKK